MFCSINMKVMRLFEAVIFDLRIASEGAEAGDVD
jgi:hypothetical protein